MTAVVRQAREGELDAASRVLTVAFEQYRPAPGAPVAAAYRDGFERYLAEVADVRSRMAGSDLFVAEVAGTVIGAATLYRPQQPVAYRAAAEPLPWPESWACLRLMAVDPRYRRCGIGRLLAEARIARARELGAPVVALHTGPEFTASYAMYLALGWRRAPEYDYCPVPGARAEALIFSLR